MTVVRSYPQEPWSAGVHTGTKADGSNRLVLDDPGAPVYARASIAYDSMGNQLASGVVRQELGPALLYKKLVLADFPLAYWRLGETSGTVAADSSRNGYTGTYGAGMAGNLGVAGALLADPDKAAYFSGTSTTSVINATVNPWSGDFSLEIWIKPTTLVGWVSFMGKESYNINGFRFGLRDNLLAFWSTQSGGTIDAKLAGPVAGVWQHCVAVKSGNTASVYLNGVLLATHTGMYVNPAAGNSIGQGAAPFIGSLDEAAIYNYPLSVAQILAHYQAGVGAKGPQLAVNVEEATTNLLPVNASTISDLVLTPATAEPTPSAPTYARASIAYDSGGNQLASGVPRRELGPGANMFEPQASIANVSYMSRYDALGVGTLANDATQMNGGYQSAKLNKPSGAADQMSCNPRSLAQYGYVINVRVSPGQVYTASCYLRSDAAAGRQWQIIVSYYNEEGTVIAGAPGTIQGPLTSSSSTWTRVILTSTAPALAAGMQLTVVMPGMLSGESIWVSLFQFEVGATATPWKLGRSGPYGITVEEATTNLLSLATSSVPDLTGVEAAGASTTLVRDTTQINSWIVGGASAKCTNTSAGASGTAISTPSAGGTRVVVAPATTYTFSVWFATDGATSVLRCDIAWRDAAGALIGSLAQSPNQTASTLLRRMTFTATSPALTATCVIRLVCDSLPAGKSLWWSAAQLEALDHATTWQIGGTPRAAATFIHPVTAFPGFAQGTVSCWVYIDPLFANQQIERPGPSSIIWVASYASGVTYLQLFYSSGVFYAQFTSPAATAPSAAIGVGWHHFTVTWATNQVKLYVDGVLKMTTTCVTTADAQNVFRMGSTFFSAAQQPNTPIAGFQTFRRALIDAEVAVLATQTQSTWNYATDIGFTQDDYVVGGTLARDTDTRYSWVAGGAVAKLTNSAAFNIQGLITIQSAAAGTPVTAGTTYTASCWYLCSAVSTMRLQIRYLDAGGNPVGPMVTTAQLPASLLPRRATITLVAPTGAITCRAHLVHDALPPAAIMCMGAPQLEAKDHATTWQPGGTARVAASLTAPLAAFPGHQQGSVSCWYYVDPVFASQQIESLSVQRHIWSLAHPTNQFRMYHRIDSGGRLLFYGWSSGGLPSVPLQDSAIGTGWQQLTCTWNAGVLRLYLNGVLVGTSAVGTPPADMTGWTAFLIGSSDGGVSEANTPIAGFQTFRRALTDAEVLSLYTQVDLVQNTGTALTRVVLYTLGASDATTVLSRQLNGFWKVVIPLEDVVYFSGSRILWVGSAGSAISSMALSVSSTANAVEHELPAGWSGSVDDIIDYDHSPTAGPQFVNLFVEMSVSNFGTSPNLTLLFTVFDDSPPEVSIMSQFYGWGQQLLDAYPDYYQESDFMRQWLMALGFEFDIVDRLTMFFKDPDAQRALESSLPDDLEPIIASWFVRTASGHSLELWENMLGIPTDPTLTETERRAGLLVRMQTTISPTPQYIREQLLQYVEDLEIIEHFDLGPTDLARYSFDIHILRPTGFSPAIKSAIEAMIRRIKPSHLGYLIIYSEVTWNSSVHNLGDMTWADLGNTTWANLNF